MSEPTSLADQQPSALDRARAEAIRQRGRSWLGRVALAVGCGLTVLISGIVIGNAARKRFDRWTRGY